MLAHLLPKLNSATPSGLTPVSGTDPRLFGTLTLAGERLGAVDDSIFVAFLRQRRPATHARSARQPGADIAHRQRPDGEGTRSRKLPDNRPRQRRAGGRHAVGELVVNAISACPQPVLLNPDLGVANPCLAWWLDQVTLRLRREIAWCWHLRGEGKAAAQGVLPPFADPAAREPRSHPLRRRQATLLRQRRCRQPPERAVGAQATAAPGRRARQLGLGCAPGCARRCRAVRARSGACRASRCNARPGLRLLPERCRAPLPDAGAGAAPVGRAARDRRLLRPRPCAAPVRPAQQRGRWPGGGGLDAAGRVAGDAGRCPGRASRRRAGRARAGHCWPARPARFLIRPRGAASDAACLPRCNSSRWSDGAAPIMRAGPRHSPQGTDVAWSRSRPPCRPIARMCGPCSRCAGCVTSIWSCRRPGRNVPPAPSPGSLPRSASPCAATSRPARVQRRCRRRM